MFLELTPRTPAGAHLCALAGELAGEFAANAAAHDRDASYPHEGVAALREAGYFAAPIPAEFGGLGVDSVFDLIVASSILARGDASVAIGLDPVREPDELGVSQDLGPAIQVELV